MAAEDKLRFGSTFVLDLASQRLLRAGVEVPLRAKTFAVLCHLATHPEILITKEELFAAVWEGASVTDTVLAASISELRRALEEDAREPRHIQTVHRKGYRFLPALPADHSPVPPAAVQAQASPDRQPPQPTVAIGTLCGRGRELATLHRELALAAAGTPRLVFVTGEGGEGKTTLVQTFVDSLQTVATAATPIVTLGQCLPEYDVGEPFLPILEGLARLLRGPARERLRHVLNEFAPDWLALLDKTSSPTFVTQDRMLFEMMHALDEFTADTPLVLVLEDLHWSDPSTLALLHALSLRASTGRLLVVGTYRPVDAILGDSRIGDFKRDVLLKRRGCEIRLEGLTPAAVEEYYAQRYQDPTLAAQLARVVLARTEGIPLFLVALAEDMEARGILRCEERGWVLHGSPGDIEAAIPPTIREMIEQRMEVLTALERSVLEAGAVAGDGFTVALIAAAAGEPLRAADDCCVRLSRRHRFLIADGESRWPDGTSSTRFRFVHRWYSSVLYGQLSETHRRDLHAAIAARLETAYAGKLSSIAAELAVHFERAGERRRAAESRLAAGRSLLRHSASDEAIAHLERGLEALNDDTSQGGSSELVLNLRAHLAMALLQKRGYAQPEVGVAYESLLTLTRPGGDSVRHLQALTGLAMHRFAHSRLAESLAVMNDGISMGRRLGLSPYFYLGLVVFTAETQLYQGRIGDAADIAADVRQQIDALEASQPRTENLSIVDTGVFARTITGLALETRGRHEEAQAASVAAIARAENGEHAYSLVSALSFHCIRLALMRDWQAIEAVAPRALALADEHGFAHFRWAMRILLGRALTARGAATEGLGLIEDGLELRRAMQVVIARPFARLLIAQSYADAGRASEALEWSRQAVDHGTEERWLDADVLLFYGNVLLRSGEESSANVAAMFARAKEIALGQGALLFAARADEAMASLGR